LCPRLVQHTARSGESCVELVAVIPARVQLGERIGVGGDRQLDVDAVWVAGLLEELLRLRRVVGLEVIERGSWATSPSGNGWNTGRP
jgi:hypothetical protein